MPFCVVCFLRRLHHSQQNNRGQSHSSPPDLTTELEDSRRFSLGSLMTLLAISMISGSKALQPVVSILFIYTISLHLSANTCFLQNDPVVSRLLHIVPLLGMSCMAIIELISSVQSPALATIGILLGVLPLVIGTIHHGRHYVETPAARPCACCGRFL